MKRAPDVRFVFLGTSRIAVYVLDVLKAHNFLPTLIVTPPQKPRGRGLPIIQTAVEVWAQKHAIEIAHDFSGMKVQEFDVGIVVDYGAIIPSQVLTVPKKGFLNVHPSILPQLRGPSPIRTAILRNQQPVGVTIMVLDEKMDHGPIVAQKSIETERWPLPASELERELMRAGGELLAQILPLWIAGRIDARPQNHDIATYSEKIQKNDGLLNLGDDPYTNLLKIRAYEEWPGTFSFFERGGKRIRVGIMDAHIENRRLIIDTVKPEGKREMGYADFLRSGAQPARDA